MHEIIHKSVILVTVISNVIVNSEGRRRHYAPITKKPLDENNGRQMQPEDSPTSILKLIRKSGKDASCEKYDGQAEECRANKCAVGCGSLTCLNATSVTGKGCCSSKCFDICSCQKSANCEYNAAAGTCRQIRRDRTCSDTIFAAGECRRPDAFYLDGGVPCINRADSGKCDIDKNIFSVNLGGSEYWDKRGIQYATESSEMYLDEYNTRATNSIDGELTFMSPSSEERQLYSNYVKAIDQMSHPKWCLEYPIVITEDGMYELNLRTIESWRDKPGQRLFNIIFNDVPILPEVDLFKVIGAKYKGAEFILNFVVSSAEGSSQKIMLAKGHEPQFILNGKVVLKFCYSSCEIIDPRFIVAAFSLIKFKKTMTGIPLPSPSPPVGPDECNKIEGSDPGSICMCKKLGCEFNLQSGRCEEGNQVCNEDQITAGECARPGYFYAVGGVVCRNVMTTGGDCTVKNVVKAVNLNGATPTHIGKGLIGDITYNVDIPDDYVDPENIRTPQRVPPYGVCPKDKIVDGIDATDIPLYTNYIYGKNAKREPDRCISYVINFSKDGPYQLLLNTYEPYHKKPGMRMFTVKLQKSEILKEVDLFVTNRACKATNFIVNFWVTGGRKKLLAKGHPEVDLDAGGIANLKFCYSGCGPQDPNWIMSAFSVYELREGKPPVTKTTTTTAPTPISTTTSEEPPPVDITTTPRTSTEAPSTELPTDAPETKKPPVTEPTEAPSTETPTDEPPTDSGEDPHEPGGDPPDTKFPTPSPPPPPDNVCTKVEDNDACKCKKTEFDVTSSDEKLYCNYDESTGLCTAPEGHGECNSCSSPVHECRRHGAFYADGGVICKNEWETGNCQAETTLAVNFNSHPEDINLIDRFGIHYHIGIRSPIQPQGNWNGQVEWDIPSVTNKYDHPKEAIKEEDGLLQMNSVNLYAHGFTSDKTCLNIKFLVQKDGDYEFSVKLIDTEGKDPIFSMKLNGHYISQLFRTRDYAGEYFAMDLNIHFRIRDNMQTFHMKGFPPTKLKNNKILFEACPTRCIFETFSISDGWYIGGVSLVKFADMEEREGDICKNYTSGRSADVKSACTCKLALSGTCEIDAITGVCYPRESMFRGGCHQCLFGHNECRWENAYYMNGGILCHQLQQAGNCKFNEDDIVEAINFNSNDTQYNANNNDSIGIKYKVHKEHTCTEDTEDDSLSVKRTRYIVIATAGDQTRLKGFRNENNNFIRDWNNTYPENQTSWVRGKKELTQYEKELYATMIYGSTQYENSAAHECVNCSVQLRGDGAYELGILTGDFYYNNTGKRLFSYKINEHFVVKEIDLIATSGHMWKPLRIVVHFIVSEDGTKLHIKGFPPTKLSNGRITFGICYGECLKDRYVADNHWHISAYYVIKFPNPESAGGYSLLDSRPKKT